MAPTLLSSVNGHNGRRPIAGKGRSFLSSRRAQACTLLTIIVVYIFIRMEWAWVKPHVIPLRVTGAPRDPSLGSKLAASEERYKEMLIQRKALIKKFGPTPSDVVPLVIYLIYDVSFCG